MKQAIRLGAVLTLLAPAAVATMPRPAVELMELGLTGSGGSPEINNRGDVVAANALLAGPHLIELPPLPGESFVTAFAINQRRQVAGWAGAASGIHACLWQDGVATDLGTLGGNESAAFDVNERGEIAGLSRTADDEVHGFIWKDGVMENIGPVTFVTALNNRGDVVGGRFAPSGLNAFLASKGRFIDLGRLPGAWTSTANDINDHQQVVGSSEIGVVQHAFFWERGAMVELGMLPGGTAALASKINNRGDAVGSGTTASGHVHGILWQNKVAIDLGTLPGGTYSYATGINDRGDIVGIADNASRESVVVRWRLRPAPAQSNLRRLDGFLLPPEPR